MTIPMQKKERNWHDPPEVQKILGTLPSEEQPVKKTFKSWLWHIFVEEKSPAPFIIAEISYLIPMSWLMLILPSWMYYVNKSFDPWWLAPAFDLTEALWLILFIVFYTSYKFDWQVPHIEKLNAEWNTKSRTFKTGYFVGTLVAILIIVALALWISLGISMI